ncbi:uncharacterized protein LOC124691126 [Lolium rigidum]|uniref:uncharacterized protein LOC124691126 n=1 Tax=Lolium rigidum TaxID=89674 RepID=UPI001F5D724E|nr:uncharacterized protein LOC124691126 [Lolium rigidum]
MENRDIFDCIDVNLQPAFDHPLLKGHNVQMKPSSFPLGLDIESLTRHGVSQVQPPIIECPMGTIPILRNHRKNHIARQSIDDVSGTNNQQEEAGIEYRDDDIYGTQAIINVYEPKVKKDSKDLSAAGLNINNGPQGGQADTIGAGYSVSPSLSGDGFARFHVAWDEGVQNKSCYDLKCPGFVQISNTFGLGGRLQPVSVYNGPQYVINILIFKDADTKNWWLIYGEEKKPIGYWPNDLFTYMKDKGNYAFWGGHVSGPTASTDSPQIGSGHFASEGYGKAAFTKNIKLVDGNNNLVNPREKKAKAGTTSSSKYTVDGYEIDKDGMHTYYGGPGDLA